MALSVIVREYAELTTRTVESNLARTHIPQSCFDWLVKQQAYMTRSGKPLLQMVGQNTLKLDSYVGFLQSPCGTSIEILPKHFRQQPDLSELEQSRKILLRMIAVSLDLPCIEAGIADIHLLRHPIPEWLFARFLHELDQLYKRGIRHSYQEVEEESRFLKARLNTGRQLRQPPGRDHLFQIRHELFTADRPENRLLRLALELARHQVKESANWRLANEFSHLLNDIPISKDTASDFKVWGNNRLMASYQAIRPWCELIIQKMNPTSQKGTREGISLLFEMEKLFESYVAQCFRDNLALSWTLKAQASSQYLCRHQPCGSHKKGMFQLKPDLICKRDMEIRVFDTKWKIIDSSIAGKKYLISQADFYQMYAYGRKYMNGSGDMFLVYPRTDLFQYPLPVFDLDDDLRLWTIPFDLDTKTIVCEGQGELRQVLEGMIHSIASGVS